MSIASDVLVKRFDGPFGAEITGIDATHEFDAATVDAIRSAIDQNFVVVLRNQKLVPADFVRFASYFGKVSGSLSSPYKLKENPLISIISNVVDETGKNIGRADAGEFWHTDGPCLEQPTAYTLLYALEIPHRNGTALGNTQFVSTADAYDALSHAMKRRLAGLKAIHKLTRSYDFTSKRKFSTEAQAKNPDRIHPLIRMHPNTGRKCIYVTENYTDGIVGMDFAEGRALLDELCNHCTQPRFYYSYPWQIGDLLMWDDCATQHKSTMDYALPQRRLLYRLTVKGGVPF